MQYKNPAGGTDSSIGKQFNTFYYQRKALIEAKKETFFGQHADTENMPKNMGKTIKMFHYLPMLDDANINDQGIDAAGLSSTMAFTIVITPPGSAEGNIYTSRYAVGEGSTAALAKTAAEARALVILVAELGFTGASYAAAVTDALSKGALVDATATSVPVGGNLYGSSKDVGTISSKLPVLSENGGRVNRVGFRRIELEGSLEKFGFFDEYNQESLDFDTDADLQMHINREMIMGANEITEDALQIDLLNAAGVVRYGGEAVSTDELKGEGVISNISYRDLMRLSIELDENRCPKHSTLITGTQMTDTKTVNAARYIHIGSELIPMVKRMKDEHGDKAFISVEKYAAGGTVATGEIGQVDQFKFIVVPEMMHWAGAGAAVTANEGYRETGGKYDVFPMLVIGEKSFSTIGFQTSGKSVKFKIKHVAPGSETSYGAHDPYGEKGFMSIKWYYGSLVSRPERIALCKTVAEW